MIIDYRLSAVLLMNLKRTRMETHYPTLNSLRTSSKCSKKIHCQPKKKDLLRNLRTNRFRLTKTMSTVNTRPNLPKWELLNLFLGQSQSRKESLRGSKKK